jgi:hypothetical protein
MRMPRKLFVTLFLALGIGGYAQQGNPQESVVPKNRSKVGRSETVWVDKSKIQSFAGDHKAGATPKDTRGLEIQDDCAGQWTRAVCLINEPNYQNMLVVPNATSGQDAINRGRKCRSDIIQCSYFLEGPRLACAPYILCSALKEDRK